MPDSDMKVLILGGTQFLGRHIVECLLEAGHSVSILNRGLSPGDLPSHVERLRGDRDAGTAGLAALIGRTWDACIDVSGYTPRQVRPSAELLRTAVGRYVFISAVRVYGDPQRRPVDETQPRQPPAAEDVVEINDETYAALKVTCESIVEEVFAENCALLRPQVVAGPGDNGHRYTYWVQRSMRGGDMLAPGDGSDHLQVIDVRDLARFVRTGVENGLSGIFNLAGPRLTWAAFIRILGADQVIWVPTQIIKRAGLTLLELPLFRPEHGRLASLMDVSSDRARAAGLKWTEPEVTAREVGSWCLGRDWVAVLSPEREKELVLLARRGDALAAPTSRIAVVRRTLRQRSGRYAADNTRKRNVETAPVTVCRIKRCHRMELLASARFPGGASTSGGRAVSQGEDGNDGQRSCPTIDVDHPTGFYWLRVWPNWHSFQCSILSVCIFLAYRWNSRAKRFALSASSASGDSAPVRRRSRCSSGAVNFRSTAARSTPQSAPSAVRSGKSTTLGPSTISAQVREGAFVVPS
jgi:2'-hydroxyisoflavone reductase